jgi:hypothetical protein
MKGMIIITEAPLNPLENNYNTGDLWRYTPQSRIVAVNPDKATGSSEVLTNNYFSARAFEISYDGKSLLFAGQIKQGDPWKIWEMNLESRKCGQVSFFPENCIDPAYLPGGYVVFSRASAKDSSGCWHQLYTCKLDGSNAKQITFHPHADFASSVLADGRILTITRQMNPAQPDPMLLVLRPDGTKADVYYRPVTGGVIYSRAWETKEGNVLFIENESIISINRDRPLHTRINLTDGIKGFFRNVFPLPSGKLLVSYRSTGTENFALFEFDPKTKNAGKSIFSDQKYNVLDALLVEEHARPRKLPSEVDLKVKTGQLLIQDINIRELAAIENPSSIGKASSIEILGMNTLLGVVKAEEDGSFYLKVMADKPFRIQMLDSSGKAIGNPCAWIFIRPNERRGCIGCHEDHDLVPENKVSLAVKKAPVYIPVHISGIKEKKVTLE